MKHTPNNAEAYAANGYKDRKDYLNSLADDRGIDRGAIEMIAGMLGESEYFDGLVSELDDLDDAGLLDDFRTGSDGDGTNEEPENQ